MDPINSYTESGLAIYHLRREIRTCSIRLGFTAEEFNGELAGLTIGVHNVLSIAQTNPTIHHLHFFSDSLSAIQASFNPMLKAGQLLTHDFHKTICKFLDSDPQFTVRVTWIPSHKDIKGNYRADELAKAGVELSSLLPMA